MKNLHKYLICFIIGIILYYIINTFFKCNIERLNIGGKKYTLVVDYTKEGKHIHEEYGDIHTLEDLTTKKKEIIEMGMDDLEIETIEIDQWVIFSKLLNDDGKVHYDRLDQGPYTSKSQANNAIDELIKQDASLRRKLYIVEEEMMKHAKIDRETGLMSGFELGGTQESSSKGTIEEGVPPEPEHDAGDAEHGLFSTFSRWFREGEDSDESFQTCDSDFFTTKWNVDKIPIHDDYTDLFENGVSKNLLEEKFGYIFSRDTKITNLQNKLDIGGLTPKQVKDIQTDMYNLRSYGTDNFQQGDYKLYDIFYEGNISMSENQKKYDELLELYTAAGDLESTFAIFKRMENPKLFYLTKKREGQATEYIVARALISNNSYLEEFTTVPKSFGYGQTLMSLFAKLRVQNPTYHSIRIRSFYPQDGTYCAYRQLFRLSVNDIEMFPRIGDSDRYFSIFIPIDDGTYSAASRSRGLPEPENLMQKLYPFYLNIIKDPFIQNTPILKQGPDAPIQHKIEFFTHFLMSLDEEFIEQNLGRGHRHFISKGKYNIKIKYLETIHEIF
tara:strand:+ start:925 stop:2592 length:1668 start_codon:yes stop_codon:yes gene_type:complete